MVWTPAEDARPSATETTSKVQTKSKEEKARRDLFAMDGVDQLGSTRNSELTRSGGKQRCMVKGYPPTQINPILICDGVERLDPAQRPCGQCVKR